MARYYFHIIDGHIQLDAEGVEFDDLQAVRESAVRFAGAIIAEKCDAALWNGRPWTLCVTDTPDLNGPTLFTLSLSVTEGGSRP